MVDAENEVLVLKRKHASSLRELTRELQSYKKQVCQLVSMFKKSNFISFPNKKSNFIRVTSDDKHF